MPPLLLVVLKLNDLGLIKGIFIVKQSLNQFRNAVFLIEDQVAQTFIWEHASAERNEKVCDHFY